mmetsp:Transcript_5220/g.5985  ORF Transcript_5220/g.5985 Transcript_5220/m.5985 type:complete len:209 (-) Transcript_5220:44-670(-)
MGQVLGLGKTKKKDKAAIQIDDPAVVKHALDDAFAKFIVEEGYEEDVSWSNFKLVMGFTGVAFALLGQFYPMPFPASRLFLAVCVVVYFILHTGLQFIIVCIDKDKIMFTYPKKTQGPPSSGKKKRAKAGVAKADATKGLCIESNLTRYETDYTLTVSYRGGGGPKYSKTLQITDFFDTEGMFLPDAFNAAGKDILRNFEKRAVEKRE